MWLTEWICEHMKRITGLIGRGGVCFIYCTVFAPDGLRMIWAAQSPGNTLNKLGFTGRSPKVGLRRLPEPISEKKVVARKVLKTHSATSCLNVELCWAGIRRYRCAHQTRPELSFRLHFKFLESALWCKNCAGISEDRRFRGQTHPLGLFTQKLASYNHFF